MTPERYSDDEMALIIRRAAMLQAADEGEGHSLAEIQAIAAQVGIPPELVVQVAAELPTQPPPGSVARTLLGPAATYIAAGDVPAVVSPGSYSELVTALRATAGRLGRASELGRSLEWRASAANSELTVTVVPRADATHVRVEGNYEGWRRLPYWATVVIAGVLGLAAAEAGPVIAASVALGALAGGWAVARAMWGVFARRLERRVMTLRDATLDRVRVLAADTEPGGGEARGTSADRR